ncbi:MAG: J domain-containing protein [Dehalococcoidales bacterium]|nr:J domain-containing protein [Dehalococcoidales bacterium]
MANFLEVDEARKILGLGDVATLKDIKRAYRMLAHRHHPDKHSSTESNEDGIMKKLNWAYKLLTDYCDAYKYRFREEDVARTYPSEEYMRKWREKWFNSI